MTLVYECPVKTLCSNNNVWQQIWNLFQSSCTQPRHDINIYKTPIHNMKTYDECFAKPSIDKDDRQPETRYTATQSKWIGRAGHFYRDPMRNPTMQRARQLIANRLLKTKSTLQQRGDFLYPPFGYRSWHTDKRIKLGWRMYIVHVDTPGGSVFRVRDPGSGNVLDYKDTSLVRLFRVTSSDAPLWHTVAVGCKSWRWSWGFHLSDADVETLLDTMPFIPAIPCSPHDLTPSLQTQFKN